MSSHHNDPTVWVKLTWTWLLVGLSQMSPLQVVQFVAAIVATVYTSVQLFFLLRDRIKGVKK
jgi:hypothetical protein